jgi:alpha-1,3-mannosyltransferase
VLRVAHLATAFWPHTGGLETFVLELATRSRTADISPIVLTPNITPDGVPLPESDEVQGIPIRRFPILPFRYYKPPRLPVAELRAADVLHVHSPRALLDFAVFNKLRHGRPIVLSTHGGLFHAAEQTTLKRLYFYGFHRAMQRFVDLTVASSRSDFDEFAPVAPAGRLVLIENGVALEPFEQLPPVPRHPERLLYVGRQAENKQIEKLLATVGELKRRGSSLRLRLVGPEHPINGPALREIALREGLTVGRDVEFVGPVSQQQLIEEYASARFFVSAARHEGFGISAVEAMAGGCVPILNDIPVFRYLVTERKTGHLVPFDEPTRAAMRIEQIASGDVSPLAERARARAWDFAWGRKIEQWRAAYDRVVDPSRS